MAVGRAGYVGLVRLEDGSLNVAAALEPDFVRRLGGPGTAAAAIVEEAGFPPFAALCDERWHGTLPLSRATWPVASDRLFVLGDAAGYVEPFTGEGVAWAMTSALAIEPFALRAIERWDSRLAQKWSRFQHRSSRRRQRICRFVTVGLRQPLFTRLGVEALRWLPAAGEFIVKRLNRAPLLHDAS
jgi:flavin-dependent dehydrogenase